mgnify:CR=1 FL=1
MIISTKRGTPAAELDKIIREFEAKGLSVTMIRGTDYNVFGLVGDTTVIDEKQVRANPYVENVQRVSEPYKKANRLFHEADSIIDVGGIKVGGSEKIAVIGVQHRERGAGRAHCPRSEGRGRLHAARRRVQAAHLSLCVPGPWHRGHFGHGGGA